MSTEPEQGYRPFAGFRAWQTSAPGFDAADRYFELLATSKAESTTEQLRAAVEVATRYAAVDTGALEGLYSTNRGFTRTIATQAATWQAALAERGEPVRRTIEDQLAAYEMVFDLATGHREVSASWIRQLHEVVCASQETYEVLTEVGTQQQALPRGQWKLLANNPTSRDTGRVHHYAAPNDVAAEMTRLMDELRSPAFLQAHPVLQTAYAHYAFVCVHPFADGNGRVARALASVYLYRRPGVPLVIFVDQKDAYLDALEAADDGTVEPFVAFIAQRAIDAIELVRLSLGEADTVSAERAVSELARAAGRGGLSFPEVDALRSRLSDLVATSATSLLSTLSLPQGFTAGVGSISQGPKQAPSGYRSTPASSAIPVLHFQSPAPGDVSRMVELSVFAARADAPVSDFIVTAHAEMGELDVAIRQVHPVETRVVGLKVESWLRGVINSNLGLLAEAARRKLQEQGYL